MNTTIPVSSHTFLQYDTVRGAWLRMLLVEYAVPARLRFITNQPGKISDLSGIMP